MVRMWYALVSLMRSRIAARVEDFPEPVGPVTSTMPFFMSAMWASSYGSFSSSKVGMLLGMTRITMAWLPRCTKTFTRKRAVPGRL